MRCSCCGGAFSRDALPAGGILRCRRRAWPVVEEIAVLKEGPETDHALDLLASGRKDEAVAVLAAPPFRSRLDVARMRFDEWVLGRPARGGPAARRVARRLEVGSRSGFERAVRELFGQPPWRHPGTASYFAHRRSDPSFVAAEALAAALLSGRGPVLDLGCGVGHLLASLSITSGPEEVAGADELFAALLFARRYVAPGAFLVCADAGSPLPFEEGLFEAVICSDALFDFPSLPLAVAEIARVLAPRGTALFPHLHNRLVPHRYAGRCPLSPAEYVELLAPLDPLLVDERCVLEAALGSHEEPLPWTRDASALNRSWDLAAVGGFRPESPIVRGPIPPVPAGPLAVNPLYEARREGDTVRLRRGPHRYTVEEERGEIVGLLPEEAAFSWDAYRRLPSWEAPPRLPRALVQARVVLPLPAGTLPEGRGFLDGAPPPPDPPSRRSKLARVLRAASDRNRATALARKLHDESRHQLPEGGLVILAGHRVTNGRRPDPLALGVPACSLARFLEVLALAGKLLPFGEGIALLASCRLPAGLSFALSFDDGTEDTLEWGAAVLREHGVRAAAFLCGPEAADSEGRFWWDRSGGGGRRASPRDYALCADVFSIGHHTRSHRSLETLPEAELEQELAPLDVAARPWLAYPFGRMEDAGPRAARAARRAGFEAAFTMQPGIAVPGANPLLLPRIPLYDEPASALLERILVLLEAPLPRGRACG